MDFSSILKKLREENHLTQQDLGRRLNLSKASISKYETGKLQPSLETLNFFADFFNVSTDYLLGRTSTRNPYCQHSRDLKLLDPSNTYYTFDKSDLSEEALKLIEEYIDFIRQKYGIKKDCF